MFGNCHFQSFFPNEQSGVLPNKTEDMKIYKLSAGDESVHRSSHGMSTISFLLGFFFCQKCHTNIKLEIDKTRTKQQGVRLASPSGERFV